MIPDIKEIIDGLLSGQYTKDQALAWINRHLELASNSDEMRDLYAAHAMHGLLAKNGSCHPKDAFDLADAMLKARMA